MLMFETLTCRSRNRNMYLHDAHTVLSSLVATHYLVVSRVYRVTLTTMMRCDSIKHYLYNCVAMRPTLVFVVRYNGVEFSDITKVTIYHYVSETEYTLKPQTGQAEYQPPLSYPGGGVHTGPVVPAYTRSYNSLPLPYNVSSAYNNTAIVPVNWWPDKTPFISQTTGPAVYTTVSISLYMLREAEVAYWSERIKVRFPHGYHVSTRCTSCVSDGIIHSSNPF